MTRLNKSQPAKDETHWLDWAPNMIHLQVEEWCSGLGLASYRSQQISEHIRCRRASDVMSWSNLPKDLRQQLAEGPLRNTLHLIEVQQSTDGTRKYGFQLHGGALIEAVWIPTEGRGTLCVSSQAGCPAGCTFCATATGGFLRNLKASEILGQFLYVVNDLAREQLGEVTQIVFMGMGEPLLNYEALSLALQTLTAADGFRFSPRRLTVSTVGIASKMQLLIDDFPQVRLALSLHSAISKTRNSIVPVNRKFGIDQLWQVLSKMKDYSRRVTLEYVVLTAVNESKEEAEALAKFAAETSQHINLLPFHPFAGAAYPPTSHAQMLRFKEFILDTHYRGDVTIRKSRGLDIQGACGQLALHKKKLPVEPHN